MKKFIIMAVCCAVTGGVFAAGFQASLTPNIAVHDRDTEINGVSIGVWNENPSPNFNWQFGFVNGATSDSVGVQWWVFLPTFYNYAENYTGGQIGFVNYTSGDFIGLQSGAVNIAGTMIGAQLGAVNWCNTQATGFQGGVVNYSASAQNLFQLGLVNIIADNAWFKDFPGDFAKGFIIVNWSFGSK